MGQGLGSVASGEEQYPVDFLDLANGFRIVAAPSEANGIDSHIAQRVAGSLGIRRNILAHQRTALQDAVTADMDKLMHRTHAANDGVLVDFDVPGQVDRIGDDGIVLDDTIVGNMRVGHDENIVPNRSRIRKGSAAVDGGKFADGAVLANDTGGFFTPVFQILRYAGNDRTGKDAGVFSYSRTFVDDSIGTDPASIADFYITFDGHKSFNRNILSDFGAG